VPLGVREGRGKTLYGSKGRFFPHLPGKSLIIPESRTISSESSLSMGYEEKTTEIFSRRFLRGEARNCAHRGDAVAGDWSWGKFSGYSVFPQLIVRACRQSPQRTMAVNALRAHLAEFGVVAPQGSAPCRRLGRSDRREQSWLAGTGAVDLAAHRGAAGRYAGQDPAGCARGPAVRLRIMRLQFAYLLGLHCAPVQVRRELHDLADRFAGYLRDV
jgi:hypothetical protein